LPGQCVGVQRMEGTQQLPVRAQDEKLSYRRRGG
jgi:hypothetical protein